MNISATTPSEARLVVLPDDDDAETITELNRQRVDYLLTGQRGWAPKINEAAHQLDHRYLFCGADDIVAHDGWLDKVMDVMGEPTPSPFYWTGDLVQVVGTLDNLTSNVMAGEHATHFMVDRAYLAKQGGVIDEGPGSFLPEQYRHNWVDREFIETAKARGVFAPSTAVVEHAHHLNGAAAYDDTYRIGDASMNADAAIYESRRHLWERT